VTTYYPGRHYNKEVNGTTERTQKFYQAAGQTIAAPSAKLRGHVRTNGELKWILSDHLGSTSVTANADGTWNSELRYTPYGETRYNSGLTPSDYRYTGQLQQAELGLYYYVARWYDPALGRFIQADTYVPESQGVQAWDRYAFVNNNPLKLTDPTGHYACGDGIDDPRCDEASLSFQSGVNNRPGDPMYDPEYSTWRKLREGAKCAACHVVHDGYMDDGRIPDNSKLDSNLVDYYKSLDPLSLIVHQAGINYTLSLATMPIEPFDSAFLESPRRTGDFPERSTNRYLYRETGPGQTAGFAEYDSSGRVVYRVDLEGPAHGGINTPHRHDASWNINPNNGVEFFNGWGRTATNADLSALFYILFGH